MSCVEEGCFLSCSDKIAVLLFFRLKNVMDPISLELTAGEYAQCRHVPQSISSCSASCR